MLTPPTKVTRYNCLSHPPPSLDLVLREIRKHRDVKKLGYFPHEVKKLMSVAGSVNRSEYDNLGRTDDLRRFLINTGIFVEDSGEKVYYFDDLRADLVADCCKNGIDPGTQESKSRRLVELKQDVINRHAKKSAEKTTESESGQFVRPVTETETLTDAQPVKEMSLMNDKATLETHVLHLTHVEDDVWTTLCVLAKETCVQQTRVATDDELDVFARKYASQTLIESTAIEDWKKAVARFETYGLISKVRGVFKTTHGFAYKFCKDWQQFHVVSINKRTTIVLPSSELAALRDLKQTIDPLNQRMECGILWEANDGRVLPCWHGFERVDFVERKAIANDPSSTQDNTKPNDDPEMKNELPPSKSWKVGLNPDQAALLLRIAHEGAVMNIQDTFDYKNRINLISIGLLVRHGVKRWATWNIGKEVASHCLFFVSNVRTSWCRDITSSDFPISYDWVSALQDQVDEMNKKKPEEKPSEESRSEKPISTEDKDESMFPDLERLTDDELLKTDLAILARIAELDVLHKRYIAEKEARARKKIREIEERRRILDEQQKELETRLREIAEARLVIEQEIQSLKPHT